MAMHKVLERIIAHKRREVAAAKARRPLDELAAALGSAPPARGFAAALVGPGVSLIAEIKRRSPSAGEIRESFYPTRIARIYERHGAAAISVLTDERFFGGSLSILRRVRRAVGIPVLRKDFIIDRYQLYEARAAGADAVLLIVGFLRGGELEDLYGLARELGLDALVEVHSEAELDRAVEVGAEIIGINNRDLLSALRHLVNYRESRASLPRRVNYAALEAWGAEALGGAVAAEGVLRAMIANLPFAASFIVGFGMGLKMG